MSSDIRLVNVTANLVNVVYNVSNGPLTVDCSALY